MELVLVMVVVVEAGDCSVKTSPWKVLLQSNIFSILFVL